MRQAVKHDPALTSANDLFNFFFAVLLLTHTNTHSCAPTLSLSLSSTLARVRSACLYLILAPTPQTICAHIAISVALLTFYWPIV